MPGVFSSLFSCLAIAPDLTCFSWEGSKVKRDGITILEAEVLEVPASNLHGLSILSGIRIQFNGKVKPSF